MVPDGLSVLKLDAMNGENSPLVTNEPGEFEK
jgi:hypothetical protein